MAEQMVIINRGKVLLNGNSLAAPEMWPEPAGRVFHAGDTAGFRVTDEEAERLSSEGEWVGIRESYLSLGDDYRKVVKVAELVNWDAATQYCGRCGARLEDATEISKKCPQCGCECFPTLSPAVLVLVKRGEEALLVHAANFSRPEMHALVAGFVETGESLEECVRREVKEETDLDVRDIRYFGSQSWPFPGQMMIAFTAEYAGGEIRFSDGELTQGGFFSRENPPVLPTPPSLSRALIDAWLEGKV